MTAKELSVKACVETIPRPILAKIYKWKVSRFVSISKTFLLKTNGNRIHVIRDKPIACCTFCLFLCDQDHAQCGISFFVTSNFSVLFGTLLCSIECTSFLLMIVLQSFNHERRRSYHNLEDPYIQTRCGNSWYSSFSFFLCCKILTVLEQRRLVGS